VPDHDKHAYATALGDRLRAIRRQQGLSLHDVEEKSSGRWKTAAIASYERADRNISASQLAALAAFYRVPVTALLPAGEPAVPRVRQPRVVLNLPALDGAPRPASGPLRRWVDAIRAQRGDWAGQVLSIRHGDTDDLARIYHRRPEEFLTLLRSWSVLDATSDVEVNGDAA